MDSNTITSVDLFEHHVENSGIDITFSTCWYELKCKFHPHVFYKWINNFLANIKNHNLVIYTDEPSSKIFVHYSLNTRIKIIIKPIEEFYNYKYVDHFIKNHNKNNLLNNLVEWKVNMLWCEKVNFVYETMTKKYFDTNYYGWCDIGYFREWDSELSTWPNPHKVKNLDDNLIYYACVYYNTNNIKCLMEIVNNKNEDGLPIIPIPPNQNTIAGGFFISNKKNIEWWKDEFNNKLQLYFENEYLVKDDQIIIVDCVFTNMNRFKLIKEDEVNDNNWFLFKRYLS